MKKVKKVVDKKEKMVYYEHMNRCSYVKSLNLSGVEGMTIHENEQKAVPHVHEHTGDAHELKKLMPDEDKLYDLAELFKCFGDSTRIRILFALFENEMCVCDLADSLNMTQSAVSHQLKILKQMKLITNRREGKSIIYMLADTHVSSIIAQGIEHILE